MTQLVYGQDASVVQWVLERIPHVSDFGPAVGIGVVSDSGKPVAGIVYNEYYPECGTVQLSFAADSPIWARRETIAELLAYPFLQMGVYKVWTSTPHENRAALKVNEHIGLKQEAVLAHHYGRKNHAVIRRMFKPQYLYLYGEENGQERSESSPAA